MLGLEWQCKKAAEATGNGKRLLVVRPPSAWYGSWGGGMPQWQWPAWGYVPDTPPVPAQPPVAGNSLPARGQPPVAGNSLPAGSQPPVAGNSLPARGISTKRTQEAVLEEDEDQGDPSARSSGVTRTCNV